MTTTTEQTQDYIKEHPDIKNCLKKGLINYSSLARFIGKEINIEKKTSKEAILIAARRFREKLKQEINYEEEIRKVLSQSELDIKNKISVFIINKSINFDFMQELQKQIRQEYGTFYIIEGSDNYTVITQDKYTVQLEKKFSQKIIHKNKDLALINFKSQKEIEQVRGVIAYLTALFNEHGVNIVELLSCWTDTLFVVSSKDVNKALMFLKF
ncbi:hypothetical protein HZA97_01560 [Candidatus Woesearchaeota archaeon]|nr:hypothetical protein [Candidatus Woesearchaeota archaeon]